MNQTLPDALRGRKDDAFVDERGATDEFVPAAAMPLEQGTHVWPLSEHCRGGGTVAD